MRKILLSLLLLPLMAFGQNTTVRIGTTGFVSVNNMNYQRGQLIAQYNYADSTLCLLYANSRTRFIAPATKTHWLDGDNGNTPFASMAALIDWVNTNLNPVSGYGGTPFVTPFQVTDNSGNVYLDVLTGGWANQSLILQDTWSNFGTRGLANYIYIEHEAPYSEVYIYNSSDNFIDMESYTGYDYVSFYLGDNEYMRMDSASKTTYISSQNFQLTQMSNNDPYTFLSTDNSGIVTPTTLPILAGQKIISGLPSTVNYNIVIPAGYSYCTATSATPIAGIVTGCAISGTTMTLTFANFPMVGVNNIKASYILIK